MASKVEKKTPKKSEVKAEKKTLKKYTVKSKTIMASSLDEAIAKV